ncbi:MAG: DUF1365 domain-containing protein [Nitrospiraceae bacterium]|nr:MAG: DUF1365 domain-containing protein [Nitrospiraceae bacterium]
MESCIYEGVVRHGRKKPSNTFRYSLFMMYLDLKELEDVFRGRWLWSADHFNIASFDRTYHLGDPSVPLDHAVRGIVEERLGARPEGAIRMLTQMRYFGYYFNPVSFYYCFDKEGRRVETIIVEIHNTPWGELFCYVLGEEQNEGVDEVKKFRISKEFHISPFMDMDIRYEWEFSEPSDSVHVLMTSYKKGGKIFDAELSMNRHEISSHELSRMLMKYPFMNMKITGAIYWQALRLKLKGATFYPHPSKRNYAGESKVS